jgi:putative redox protein
MIQNGETMTDDWREIVAEWQGGLAFQGKNPAGAVVQMGSLGGTPGASPMEMVLIGLAGCTGMDVVSILEKKQQDVRGLQIVVRGKRAETHPRVYTEIELEYRVWGDVDAVAVERAIALSEEKYCSVSAMLARAAKIITRYSILPVEELV